jgi:hypothetical protein
MSFVMLSVVFCNCYVKLNAIMLSHYVECRYTEYRYTEYRYTEYRYTEYHCTKYRYTEYRYSECYYTEYRYTECYYTESHGAINLCLQLHTPVDNIMVSRSLTDS